jgi:hypothetical protein
MAAKFGVVILFRSDLLAKTASRSRMYSSNCRLSGVLVEITNSRALCIHCANSLRLVILQGIAEAFVEFQGNDRLGKLIEVSSQNVGSVVYSVTGPVQSLAVAIG